MESKIQENSESLFLLLKENEVLGPYTFEEVSQKILNREILPWDSVAIPLGLWKQIQCCPEFSPVIQRLQNESVSTGEVKTLGESSSFREKTQTLIESAKEITQKVSSAFVFADKTQKINEEDPSSFKSQTAPEHTTTADSGSRPSQASKQSNFSSTNQSQFNNKRGHGGASHSFKKSVEFINPNDASVKKEIFLSNKKLYILFGVVGVLFGLLAVFRVKNLTKHDRASYLKESVLQYERARYDEALRESRSVLYSSNSSFEKKFTNDFYIRFVQLLLFFENNITEAKKILTQYLPEVSSEKTQLLWALLELSENGKIKKDISLSEFEYDLTFNRAISFFLNNKHANSLALSSKHATAEMLFLSVLNLIAQATDATVVIKREKLVAAYRIVEQFLRNNFFLYRQEILLLKSYIKFSLGQKIVKQDIYDILDMDPDLTTYHRQNLFLYLKLFSWKNLLSYCEKLTSSLNFIESQVLNAFCFFKARDKRAESFESVLKTSQHWLARGVLAYLMKGRGASDYGSVLGYALELDGGKESALILNLQMGFCHENGDRQCVKETMLKLLSKDPKALQALSMQAYEYQRVGQMDVAKRIQSQIQILSPAYVGLNIISSVSE